MPSKELTLYHMDNSGLNNLPLLGSNVPLLHRVDYRTYTSLYFITESRLIGLYERWNAAFFKRLDAFTVNDDWVEYPDITTFFDETFRSAFIESTCGPALSELNPGLCEFNTIRL